MNIYLVKRTDKVDWDETAGVVVAADTEEEARSLMPREKVFGGVVREEDITCACIGVACEGVPRGVLLMDFNAG